MVYASLLEKPKPNKKVYALVHNRSKKVTLFTLSRYASIIELKYNAQKHQC